MKNQSLHELFVAELEDIYSAEQQIIEALPKMIQQASLQDLKEALKQHLKETQEQVTRLERIFSILKLSPQTNTCEGMEGIIREGEELIQGKEKSPTLDAAIICSAQKVEHYEIASYGTLRSFAQFLNLDSDVTDLIQDNLDEEGAANKKLTKIAEGSLFSTGVNKEAARVH